MSVHGHETDMTSHAGNVRSSGVKRTSRLCPGKAARSGQLFAQLGVGGPQFAIADPRSASSTRNGRVAAARPDRVIDFFHPDEIGSEFVEDLIATTRRPPSASSGLGAVQLCSFLLEEVRRSPLGASNLGSQ